MKTLVVESATVILADSGMDRVTLKTNLASPCPAVTDEPLDVMFFAARDTGVQYCQTVLNIEPEIIDARHERIPFSAH